MVKDGGGVTCSHLTCNRPVRAAGYCNAHYLRRRSGRDMDAPIAPHYRGAVCAAFGCSYGAVKKNLCDAHYQRIARGLPADVPIDRRNAIATTYQAVHRRMRGIRGLASTFSCTGACDRMAAEWAYNGLDPNQLYDEGYNAHYSLGVDFYEPMCIQCHRQRDRAQASAELREYRKWKHLTGLTLAESQI